MMWEWGGVAYLRDGVNAPRRGLQAFAQREALYIGELDFVGT